MKGPWILLGVGGVLFLISGAVALVSMLLPVLSNRTSPEEAMMGIIPSCCCSSISLAMVLGGIIWLVIASNQNRQN